MIEGEWMEVAREYYGQNAELGTLEWLARAMAMVAEETNDFVRYEGSGNPLTKSDRTKIIARLLARLREKV